MDNSLNIPILVTSMVEYKKVTGDLWVKSPTCRRLLHQKSVVRLSVEMSGEKDLSVNIMKHPSIAQQTIVYPNAGISLNPQVNQSKPCHKGNSHIANPTPKYYLI